MTGPTRRDFAAAVRDPAAAFADPALAAADPVLGADGLPLPHAGDRAVVFQLCAADDRAWAVKCYAAADPGLADRYARVAAGGLPFVVPALVLADGVRVAGRSHPAAALAWVEGVPLDRAVRDRAGDPAAMHQLFRAWVRLAAGLRAGGAAHGELSHTNVLVVPGADPLRLVDYDSFHFPGLPPAADAGHPNYRHPADAAPADRDRFPLLVVAAALRAVAVLGRPAWERYDAGDNLLFTAADFGDPAASPLLRELAESTDATLRTLAAELARACERLPAETPWVDDLCPGIAPSTVEVARRITVEPTQDATPERPPLWRQLAVPFALVAGVFLVGAGAVAGMLSAVLDPPDEVIVATNEPPREEHQAVNVPKPLPAATEPAGFRRVWVRRDVANPAAVVLTGDGRTVLVHLPTPNRVEALDAATGTTLASLREPGVPAAGLRAWALGPERVALYGHPLTAPAVWNPRTGGRLTDLFPGPLPLGADRAGPARCELSPDGRFAFVGAAGRATDALFAPAPYQVIEVATGRVVKAGNWSNGTARFTADGGRLLTAESGGRVSRLRLPGGTTEAEWEYRAPAAPDVDVIESLSADGGRLLLHARVGRDRPAALHLADGKTGQLLRRIGYEFTGPAALSADGRWVVGLGFDAADRKAAAALLTDAPTGAALVRTPLGVAAADVKYAAVAADGRALVVHDQRRGELAYFALGGAVPPVPAGTAVPPPVADPPPRRLTDTPDDENPFAAVRPPVPFPDPIVPGPPAIRPPGFPGFRAQPQMVPAPVPGFPQNLPAFPQPGALAPAPGLPGRQARPLLPVAPPVHARWTVAAPVGFQANGLSQAPLYTPDGKTLVLSGGMEGTVMTFDAATGAAGPVFDGHKGPGGVDWFGVFAGKVVSRGFDAKLATWDAKTGRRLDDLRFPDLDDPGRAHGGITHAVSPSGRYTVVARRDAFPPGPGALRVLDTTTGRVVVSGGWKASTGGHVAFTADEGKLFVLDGLGKGTWYKLPSGEVAAAWAAGDGAAAENARVLAPTADGRRMLYNGPLDGHRGGTALIDGTTGRVVGPAPVFPHQPHISFAISPDGRFAAAPVLDAGTGAWHTDILTADGWRVVGRISHPDDAPREYAHLRFSPDGKELAVFFRGAKRLAVYPVPIADAPAR